ncbi:methyltransferase domain-containing protein [Sphingomonas sp. PB2P19]|uniref:methyltransferase domain-containing protein n=1 Tax=Sphingomonas rhamnosi TaxID=3096156 RepID=UPI002FCA971D
MLAVEKHMVGGPNGSVLDVYQRHGAAWARQRSDRLVECRWLDCFCTLLPAGAAILDIGCGCGVPIARELVRRGFDVTGIDGAPAMVALFERNLPGVSVQCADMRELDLHRRFAGLIAWDSLFHLSPRDQRSMFPRFQAHAAPGAALMFTSGTAEGDSIGELEGEPLYHASLDTREYRGLLEAAGFVVVAHIVEDADCGRHTIWLAQKGRE